MSLPVETGDDCSRNRERHTAKSQLNVLRRKVASRATFMTQSLNMVGLGNESVIRL